MLRRHRKTPSVLLIFIAIALVVTGWRFMPQKIRDLIVPTANAANFIVNSADDHNDGTCNVADCTLREAINAVNAGAGGDTISFNIPGGGVRTINVSGALGALNITKTVTIDGTTQPGFTTTPLIELNGTNAGSVSGLTISAQDVTVKGLVINRFANFGINITGNAALIQGNFIGTDATGTNPLGNAAGIQLSGVSGVRIGGTTSATRNVISGNNGDGILITNSSTASLIQGNFIGVNALGTAALGNIGTSTAGVHIVSANNNTIGGTAVGAGNVISGNGGLFGVEGIKIQNSSNNKVEGNIIGLNAAATAKIPNDSGGIIIIGGTSNIIGGPSSSHRNVISGNSSHGILILSDNTQVKGNYLGTNGTGTAALGNGAAGVLINGGDNNLIGGSTSDRNLISGNGNGGVRIAFAADNNTVQSNAIGTDVSTLNGLGNGAGFAGVTIITSTGNSIGGADSLTGNIIAFNDGPGVSVTGTGNSILGNQMFANNGLAIDLDNDGPTLNDNCDGDTGANNKQNSPVITSIEQVGALTGISGTINAAPNTQYRIEVFENDSCDPSGNGEGKFLLGAVTSTTNASCTGTFNIGINSGSISGSVVTATATDPNGNTSEFSSCIPLGIPSANVVQFSAATYNVTEACTAVNVMVNRSGDTSGSATVKYSTSDVSASDRRDYITGLGTLSFAPGETSKTIALLINDDSFVEGPESFTISLTNPTSVNLGNTSTATIQIADNAAESVTNPIDDPQTFVCQHYHDFLNRDPDAGGLAFWTNEITSCAGNPQCIEIKRINVSAAFYLSIEFQQTGYLVEKIYKASFGDVNGTSVLNGAHQIKVPVVRFRELLRDSQEIGMGVVVGQGNWEQQLEANKNAFAAAFVQRGQFPATFPTTMTPEQFVNKLFQNTGVSPTASELNAAINEFAGAGDTSNLAARGRSLRRVAENPTLQTQEFNKAFVLMQYFGYLRRNPNDPQDTDYSGYDFWLQKLNQFNGNFIDAEMVKAFILSIEYRNRFAP